MQVFVLLHSKETLRSESILKGCVWQDNVRTLLKKLQDAAEQGDIWAALLDRPTLPSVEPRCSEWDSMKPQGRFKSLQGEIPAVQTYELDSWSFTYLNQ